MTWKAKKGVKKNEKDERNNVDLYLTRRRLGWLPEGNIRGIIERVVCVRREG